MAALVLLHTSFGVVGRFLLRLVGWGHIFVASAMKNLDSLIFGKTHGFLFSIKAIQ